MVTKTFDESAKELEDIEKQLYVLKLRKSEIEQELTEEFENRSSETNWASKIIGDSYEITRYAKNYINPDDLRSAIGEWVNPEELNKMIRPETKKIVVEPEKVMLTEVNVMKKQGGNIAELIEKVTSKTSGGIKVIKKQRGINGK